MTTRIMDFKIKQAEELEKFITEENLRLEFGIDPDKAFFHRRELYGIGASVHLREKMNFEDAIKQIQHMENILSPVDMVEVKGTFLSFMTREYYDNLPDEKAMKLGRMEALAPIKIELCKFGNSIKYFGRNSAGLVVEVKIEIDDFKLKKLFYVDYKHRTENRTSKIVNADLRLSDKVFNIFTNDGESIAERLCHRMASGGPLDEPSDNFVIVYRSYIESMEDFKIKFLREWL